MPAAILPLIIGTDIPCVIKVEAGGRVEGIDIRCFIDVAGTLEDHIVPEAKWDVEEDAEDEREADADPGILQGVYLLECKRVVDGDVPVDRDADDDVRRADTERIDQWKLKMSLSQMVTD